MDKAWPTIAAVIGLQVTPKRPSLKDAPTMTVIQRICARLRLVLLLAPAAGLWLNTLAPAGYMIAPSQNGWLAVTPCPETHPLAQRAPIAPMGHSPMDHAAMGHAHLSGGAMDHDHEDGSSGASNPCAFAGATKLATDPVDPALFLAALAFAMLLAVTAKPSFHLPRWVGLRPPSRGPPVRA